MHVNTGMREYPRPCYGPGTFEISPNSPISSRNSCNLINITQYYGASERRSGKIGLTANLQLGILIPAGIPLLPNPRTSSEVKSGRKNLSFSYAGGQGRDGRRSSALETSDVNFALISLFTTDTKPADVKG